MVERLDGLRHHAVVRGDHEDRDVGDARTTGTHGGERLVTRGVDERDGAHGALVLVVHLVRADVLGDAARLARDDVGLADGVEKSRLSVVHVTHDGDDRGPYLEFLVRLRGEFRVEVDVEVLEELAVLLLGRDDLDAVAELGAKRLERALVERLRRRGHLSQVEEDGHERRGIDVDLVGEVAQRRAPSQADRRGAVPARDLHAADGRRLLLLVFLALGTLALAAPSGPASRAAERTSGASAASAATRGGPRPGSESARCAAWCSSWRAAGASGTATATGRSSGARRRSGRGSARTHGTRTTRARAGSALDGPRESGAPVPPADAGRVERGAWNGLLPPGRGLGARRGEGVVAARARPRPRHGVGRRGVARVLGCGRGSAAGAEPARAAGRSRRGRRRSGRRCRRFRGRRAWVSEAGCARRRGWPGQQRAAAGSLAGACLLRLGFGGDLGLGALLRRGLGWLFLRGRLLGRREGITDLADDRGFERRGRSLDVLAHLNQLRDQVFARDTELFRDLVNAGLCHNSPVSVRPRQGRTIVSERNSFCGTHRELMGWFPIFRRLGTVGGQLPVLRPWASAHPRQQRVKTRLGLAQGPPDGSPLARPVQALRGGVQVRSPTWHALGLVDHDVSVAHDQSHKVRPSRPFPASDACPARGPRVHGRRRRQYETGFSASSV